MEPFTPEFDAMTKTSPGLIVETAQRSSATVGLRSRDDPPRASRS